MTKIASVGQVGQNNYQGNVTGAVIGLSEDFPKILQQVSSDKISDSDDGRYDAIFAQASACYNLPVALLKAITKVESDFNPYDVSSKGAKGLMQLMPSTAADVGVTDPFDPWQNIMGASKYIRKQLDNFGDLRTALAAYNTGPGNVRKYGGEPSYCNRYVDKVLAYMGEASVNTGNVGAAYDVLGVQGSYNSALGGLGTYYGGMGSSYGALGGLGYGMLGSLGNSYNMLGSLGSSYSLLNGLGSLGSSYSALSSLGNLGSGYGLLGSMDSSDGLLGSSMGLLSASNLASTYALSSLLSAGTRKQGEGDEDTVVMSRESFNSLIELMRIQMMMSAEETVGVSLL